ncbi:HAD family hydrolase [Anaerosacchariphilus polymeriproducens]|uniref:HAD family hydrolase n=1 Tax=Anaerosacchariphilus polymeriproducens TaxID=1812858 RepID=A0A371AV70_9FIRM|nr:HAD family hydrolase [Anaerosacchariphilus polymeriproducens]RDU23370.1 HAD family hydrolase [Anaerosacchariphilus polymeriproducens]
MYKAYIFDLDGTLADTIKSIAYTANRTLEYFGYQPHKESDYNYFVGDGAPVLIERALKAAGDTDCKDYEKVLKKFREFFRKDSLYQVKAYSGIPEALEVIKNRGYKIAVLSNKPHDNTIDVVKFLFGNDYFDYVKGHTQDVPKKPNPQGALLIAEELGIKPEECIYVGDTNTDMQTGNSAQMYTVGVLWGFRDRKELEDNFAKCIITEPEELLTLQILDKNESEGEK